MTTPRAQSLLSSIAGRGSVLLAGTLALACSRAKPNESANDDAAPSSVTRQQTDSGPELAPDATAEGARQDAGARACLQPHVGRFARCRKETSTSESDFARCLEKHATDAKTPDRFRIDGGAWQSFSPKQWRCFELPSSGSLRVEVEFLGSVAVRSDPECASHKVDISEASYGGALAVACSHRKGTTDELVGDPQ